MVHNLIPSWLLVAYLGLMTSGELHKAEHYPILVDTDVGGDDLMAIAFLLSHPGVHIDGITVANGLAHPGQGARNVLRLLQLSRREGIPVFVGRSTPLQGLASFPDDWRRTADSLSGFTLGPAHHSPQSQSACDFLIQRLKDPKRKVRILALGPLTNLGEMLQRAPESTQAIDEIVIMGGAVYVPGNLADGGYFKTTNRTAEWNMFIDPLAARLVFDSGVKITLVPLDATNKVPIDGSFLRKFRIGARTPLARFVSQILEANREYIEKNFYFAWDPLAAAIMMNPAIATRQATAIQVQQDSPNEGQTKPIAGEQANIYVALNPNVQEFAGTFLTVFGIK